MQQCCEGKVCEWYSCVGCTGLLDKLRGLAAVVERKLGDSVIVPVYGSHVASLKAAKETFKDQTLQKGKHDPTPAT